MSKNLAQVYVTNPVTTIGNTDLFYTSAAGTTDAAFTGATLKAAVSPLTTKGDLYTYSTVNARLGVGTTNGQMLQVASGAATGLAWSTPTYPSTSGTAGFIVRSNGTNNVYSQTTYPDLVAQNAILYGSAANTVGPITSAQNGVLVSSNTNVPSMLAGPGTTGNIFQSNAAAAPSFSTATYPSVATSSGTIMRANGTNWVASTSTFADTYGASTILYSNGANTVTGLATANSASLVTSSAGVPAWSASMTNGQVILGSTGATPVAATIGSSGNISLTIGAGTLSIGTSGFASFAYNDVSGTTQAAAINNGYVISNASQTTVTLPATAALGSVIAVQGKGAAGWILTANTGQTVKLGSSTTSSAGTLTSTNQFDAVEVVCITANTTWAAKSVIGNLTVA